jgi:S1-C subfamily serine protease
MPDHAKHREFNERFLRRLKKRRPDVAAAHEAALEAVSRSAALEFTEGTQPEHAALSRQMVLETIVDDERPVLFVRDDAFDTENATIRGREAEALVKMMTDKGSGLMPILPLIGRFDVKNFPGAEFIGTGWFVDTEIVVTNRHVASLLVTNEAGRFVFRRGIGGRSMESTICTAHEFDDLAPESRCFAVREVLYIEPDTSPNDIAFVRVARTTRGVDRPYIEVAANDVGDDAPVCVIGYPARASRRLIPDQQLMEDLYRGRYDVKRAAPGYSMGTRNGITEHDCTTLGGNSGSVVLDMQGRAVGLHFAGLYKQANYAVPASILGQYISRKRWNECISIEARASRGVEIPVGPSAPSGAAPMTATGGTGAFGLITIPLNITITVGGPAVAAPGCSGPATPRVLDVATVERAVREFWDKRPGGVIGARVGFLDDGDKIGESPCIAAAVRPADLASVASISPSQFQGIPIRYEPASVGEQLEAIPSFESVDSIAYDDNARRGAGFALEPIAEDMELLLHVGPEYSWETLKGFLLDDNESVASKKALLVSAMYEFHAAHIKDALEKRITGGGSLKLVLDNATFAGGPGDGDFDREPTFERWEEEFGKRFVRIVAPEGTRGLISDAYHIKVSVRKDDTLWLSSGNWKAESSQPIITQHQRDNAEDVDLPGNREWHVIAHSARLAEIYRNHIEQDFKRSEFLRGRESLEADVFVDVAIEEGVELERRPPSALVHPKKIARRPVRVHPLLTPDKEGAVYSEAVLELIRSARDSLLFQIPYIGMPSNPRQNRGYIDELIEALTQKLKELRDGRAILRSGGSKYSSPTHAAWYFKSKGVDIQRCLRVIENHHTKGMIVDGERVLVGSHNWSKSGVTLNRDASLLFDDREVAAYYAQAFEVDWKRSNPLKPRRYVKTESVLEAVGQAPPLGYRRVRLSELKED